MTASQMPTFRWVLRGMLGLFSVPAGVLLASMAGFGILCRESGLTLGQAVFTSGAIWALPSQLVLVGAIAAGSALPATAIGVALSAVRFVPMVASWVPMVRTPQTRRWQLLALSHFVAVTSWVIAATRLAHLPAEARMPFFAGFAITLTTCGTIVTGASYLATSSMPPVLAALLFFLTPLYFLMALTVSGRGVAQRLALPFGLALGPLFRLLGLPVDLLWAGLVGGTLAYAIPRLLPRRT